jgi:KUP system potassium uptake protein
VYGDIGTSALYTMKEVLNPANGVRLDPTDIIGAVSVILWMLMLIVTLKYVVLILRADNRGEGGIMALTALAAKAAGNTPARRRRLLLAGVFGAALSHGDSVITPAISVLGAVEGLETITPVFKPYVLPISIGVLIGLFMVQRRGSATMGAWFGPIMLLWFGMLAVTGVMQIVQGPGILAALNPLYAVQFLAARGWQVFVVMGSIVLALAGAQALYADMGYFRRRPIRLAWTALVLPALALNYMGQGALLLHDPTALDNPFFRLFPQGWLLATVLLATLASVIASQAVISGAFSLTKEAIQLGLLPRMRVLFTSDQSMGQIYLPAINAILLVAVLLAVLVVSCALKFMQGGWFPLVLGLALFVVMATWRLGRERLGESVRDSDPPLADFLTSMASDSSIPRSSRIAVYPTAHPSTVPAALLHNLKHYQVLHERNVLVTVRFLDVPRVPPAEQLSVEPHDGGFWTVRVDYGFKDEPNLPIALGRCARFGLQFDPCQASYFRSRERIVPSSKPGTGMAIWRTHLFAAMSRNAGSAADYFHLPDNCVIELGSRVQL